MVGLDLGKSEISVKYYENDNKEQSRVIPQDPDFAGLWGYTRRHDGSLTLLLDCDIGYASFDDHSFLMVIYYCTTGDNSLISSYIGLDLARSERMYSLEDVADT